MGNQLHKEIQAQRQNQYPSYISEVSIRQKFKYKNYIFDVRGRLDGVYQNEKTTIEEIKSAFNLNKLYTYINNEIDTHLFCLQLSTLWIYPLAKNK